MRETNSSTWTHITVTHFHTACKACSYSFAGHTSCSLSSLLSSSLGGNNFLKPCIAGSLLTQAQENGSGSYDVIIARCTAHCSAFVVMTLKFGLPLSHLWYLQCRVVCRITLDSTCKLQCWIKLPSELYSLLIFGRCHVHVYENWSCRLSI